MRLSRLYGRRALFARGYECPAAGNGEDVALLFKALDGLLDCGHGQAGLLDELLDAGDLVVGLEFSGVDGSFDLVRELHVGRCLGHEVDRDLHGDRLALRRSAR
jgi:hypothetical protein